MNFQLIPTTPNLLDTLVDFAPDGMMLIDENQEIVAYNNSFLDLWGLNADVVQAGNARAEAMNLVENPEEFLAMLRELYLDHEKTATGMLRLANGRILDWYSTGTWDKTGKYIGRAWYYRDATKRIRIQDELQRSEQLYRQLAENFPDGGVFIFNQDLEFVLADGAGLADVGMSTDLIRGRHLNDVLPRRLARQLRPVFQDTVDGIQRHVEVRFFDRVFAVTTVPLNSDAQTSFGMAIAQNVTRQKRLEDQLSGAEARLRTLVEQIPAVTYVQHVEESDNRTIFISPQVTSIFGYTPEELIDGTIDWIDTVHPEDRSKVLAGTTMTNLAATAFTMEYRALTRDGRTRWVRDEAAVVTDDRGRSRFWQGILTDITEQRRLETELRNSEAIFRSAFDFAAIGMARVGVDGRWLDVNESLCRMFGYSREELLATDFQHITHPDDLDEDLEFVNQVLDGVRSTYMIEKRYFHKDGSIVWGELSVSLVQENDGSPRFFISQIQDITRRKELEAQLQHLADHDSLTGLLNRNGLTRRLEDSADFIDGPLGVLMLDLDGFKDVNDTYGHQAGDLVLSHVAKRIQSNIRSGDVVARMGGDEFAIVMREPVNKTIAKGIAQRVRHAIERPVDLNLLDVNVQVGVSIGIHATDAGGEVVDLLRVADDQMYSEKRMRKVSPVLQP